MAEIKVETGHHHYPLIVSDSGNISDQQKQQRPKRVASLDIFRGLTVALMILVDDAGGDWPVIGHAPWNGCNLADFVMPFFLFIVGISISLSLKRISSRIEAVKKVILRTLKLLFWGILLQGNVWCERKTGSSLQCSGILRNQSHLSSSSLEEIQVLQACTQDSPYEGPLRNDAPSWCHASFEPEGILSSISAILSTIIGVHFGRAYKFEAIPLNKQLYTFSYVCVTSGAAALVFSAIYGENGDGEFWGEHQIKTMETIFSNKLSDTDVNQRLAIPSKKLNQIAPLSLGEMVSIAVIDATGHQWSFLLSTRKDGRYLKPVITGNEWLQFVRERHLREGDKITFYRETIENNEVRFRIVIELAQFVLFCVPTRRAA
ncbi:hypothetical protein Q3G72_027022 [Acer saccharum]|nr:hypothetical protein Q3G72_027022 [Acer saccharum]